MSRRVYERFMERQAAEIKTVWVVRDFNNRIEYVRELCWPEEVSELPKYVLGTSLATWEHENTKLFTDESSAMKDLEKRLKVIDKMMLKQGLYRHMHSDGRIIYVSVPDRDS